MTPLDCPAAWYTLSRVVLPQSSDIPGIMRAALKPAPKPPEPVVAPPTPQGLGVVRGNDHRLGDFSGGLS